MSENRSAFRIEVNEDYVLDLAVWFKKRGSFGRMHIKELGPPKLMQGRPPYPRIEDISSVGMALSFDAAQAMDVSKFAGVLALVYFKLVDPTDMMGDPLSFLVAYEVNASQILDGRAYIGLRMVYDAVPDPGDKAVFFADARKYGIADLTKWCDEMNRSMFTGTHSPPPPGLRLDRLLREIAMLKEAPKAQG